MGSGSWMGERLRPAQLSPGSVWTGLQNSPCFRSKWGHHCLNFETNVPTVNKLWITPPTGSQNLSYLFLWSPNKPIGSQVLRSVSHSRTAQCLSSKQLLCSKRRKGSNSEDTTWKQLPTDSLRWVIGLFKSREKWWQLTLTPQPLAQQPTANWLPFANSPSAQPTSCSSHRTVLRIKGTWSTLKTATPLETPGFYFSHRRGRAIHLSDSFLFFSVKKQKTYQTLPTPGEKQLFKKKPIL